MSRPIAISFRILGFVCWSAQRWVDIIRIKKHKTTTGLCFHPYIFCGCGINYIKENYTTDRPFLEKQTLVKENNRITQVSDKTEHLPLV